MQIETYECETLPSDEFTEEAVALAEKLGATGQASFYKANEKPNPYRIMTPLEHAVYKLIFPIREEISKYDSGPIPLRVLQVGAHAKDVLEEGTLIVWHQGAGKDDPLLTLRIGHEYNGKYFLLARWGEALEEFAVLKAAAAKRYAQQCASKLVQLRTELDSHLQNIELLAASALDAGKTDQPNYYWHL